MQPQKTKGVSVAQQVEHIPFKDGVLGSSPSWNTKKRKHLVSVFFYACKNLFLRDLPTDHPFQPLGNDFFQLQNLIQMIQGVIHIFF